MGLANNLARIQTDLVANLSAPLNLVTFDTGEKALRVMHKSPRIVWVRVPGTFGPAVQGQRAPKTTARILRTHVARVDAHVWADLADPTNPGNDSACETLAHTMVASCYRIAHGSFEVLGDDWPQPDWLTQGHLCVVGLRFLIPVTDAAPAIATAGPPWNFPFDESTAPPPSGQLQAPGDD